LRIEDLEGRTSKSGRSGLGGMAVFALRHRRRREYFANKADAIQEGHQLALTLAANDDFAADVIIERHILREMSAKDLVVALLEGGDWCEAIEEVSAIKVPMRSAGAKAVAPRRRKG
jgi:hypothetical protein